MTLSASAELYQAVREQRLDDFVARLVAKIRDEIPEYRAVPRADQERTVREQCSALLTSLSAGRPPGADDRRRAEVTARRRAEQGIPVQHVIGSFHISFQLIWQLLQEESDALGADGTGLIAAIGPVWGWVHVLSAAVADAHAEVTGSRQAATAATRQRLLMALRETGEDDEQAEQLARDLGFDLGGDFQAWCAPAGDWPPGRLSALQEALTRRCAPALCGQRGARMIVLAPGRSAVHADTVIRTMTGPGGLLGVGLARPGISGAAASAGDAERALQVAQAQGGGVVSFEADWLLAALVTSGPRLDPLLSAGRGIACSYPYLAEAVAAFAAGGFSVTAAAHALHLHPNTAGYRLTRWHQLTGWDPRTADGLMRSIVCLGLSAAPAREKHDGLPRDSVQIPKTGQVPPA